MLFATTHLVALLSLGILGIQGSELEARARIPVHVGTRAIMEFNCLEMPEVCANMCFGAFCKQVGTALTLDRGVGGLTDLRRRAAGCEPRPNRCSLSKSGVSGQNCDEYPFAATSIRGPNLFRVNRCVPTRQNSKQGNVVKTWGNQFCQKTVGAVPPKCNFDVGFSSPGQATDFCPTVCSGTPTPSGVNCMNTVNEVVGPKTIDKRDEGDEGDADPWAVDFQPRFYHLKSGGQIMIQGHALPGRPVHRVVPINATLYEEQIQEQEERLSKRDIEDDDDDDDDPAMLENLKVEEDEITSEVGPEVCSLSLPPEPSSTFGTSFSSSSFASSSSTSSFTTTSTIISTSTEVVVVATVTASPSQPPPSSSGFFGELASSQLLRAF